MIAKPKLTPAQQAAAMGRIGENLILHSGAGCGKTFVLARRFTELLMSNPEAENPLSRFVALTFTDKAALEMQQRVRKFLTARAAASKNESDRRRLLGWLQELPSARISTIHSFCAALLRTYAIDVGIDPNFAVCADRIVIEGMIDDSADQAVLAAVQQQRQDVLGLLAGIRYEKLVALVKQLVAHRTEFKADDYADGAATFAKWRKLAAEEREKAYSLLCDDDRLRINLAELAAEPCDNPDDKLLPIRDKVVEVIQQLIAEQQAWTPETFAIFDETKPGSVGSDKAWGGEKGAAKQMRDKVRELVERFTEYACFAEVPGESDKAAAEAIATITNLASEADKLYTAAKRARGILDFTDLLVRTHEFLSRNTSLRRAIGEQIDQLLIDECQDTNAFQLELLNMLVSADADADAKIPSPGRLFVVGDKKQSIYRFRGAQVEVFERLCRRLGTGNQESLDLSFRTHAAGIAFVNELFAPLMGDDYERVRAHRKELPPGSSVEIILACPSDAHPLENAADASDLQAAATAQRIGEMLAGGERLVRRADQNDWRAVRPGDIAILFSRMTNSVAYEHELAGRDIPYYVVAGTGFFRRQEVFDVLNALRAIDNPFDDVAFFGMLRSGMFALDDEALMHIAEAIETPYFTKLIKNPGVAIRGLSETQNDTLAFAVKLLSTLNRRKDAVGIDTLIEQALAATGYEATLLAQFNGRQMLGNVRRLIDLARTASFDAAAPADFITQMNEQIIDQSRFEQAAVSGEAEDVVRIMTIHKAKGLEFPVVFMPDLNFAYRGVRDEVLNRLDWGLTFKLKTDEEDETNQKDQKDADTPLFWRITKTLEEKDQKREDIRKLYVAATRHRDHLVFVAADWRTKNNAFKNKGSYINLMDGVLDIAAAADRNENIPYADGRFEAAVKKISTARSIRTKRDGSIGGKILSGASSADEFAAGILEQAGATGPPMVGATPATTGGVEIAVTALTEFEHCPMLYLRRYELRTPALPGDVAARRFESPILDPATMGTLYHRCMELLDFAAPQPAAALVRQTISEMDLTDLADTDTIADELENMLAAFRRQPLWARLAKAKQMFRELDFVLQVGPATLHGQIDLLYEDAGGHWHIIDYKSDRVGDQAIAPHARQYELQMFAYAAAAARHIGQSPVDASLYFLRPAVEYTFELTGDLIAHAESRIEKLAAELISARRGGKFSRNESPACKFCPYEILC